MYCILRCEANAVGYWREGEGFVGSAEDATLYATREEGEQRADNLARAERWRFLVHGATMIVVLA